MRIVTGIKPTGAPHLGNYLGVIQPTLQLATSHELFVFVADHHALTTLKTGSELRRWTYEISAAWLALGLDAKNSFLYRQSDVPETFELQWILECFAPKGLLNRGHAYKSAVAENQRAGNHPDAGVNAGIFSYPVLMAADILLMEGERVPVGQDQVQHVEIARDLAEAVNRQYGDTLTVPGPIIRDDVALVPGIDGRKMSASYGNVIPVFASPDELLALVMRIKTDSRRPEEPKDPEQCNVFQLYRHFASEEDVRVMSNRYQEGGLSYQEAKKELYAQMRARLDGPRETFLALMDDIPSLDALLASNSTRVQPIARATLGTVKARAGLGREPLLDALWARTDN